MSETPVAGEPEIPIDADGIHVPSSDFAEVRTAIACLIKNKAVGSDNLPIELLKHGTMSNGRMKTCPMIGT